MPNTTLPKVYDYTTGVVLYLNADDMLPIGEAGSDSILILGGTSTANEWYNLLGGNFKLTYRAANGNIVILDDREVITPEDVHSLQSHSTPTIVWFQTFIWNINYEQDIKRKKDTIFGGEIVDTSIYDKKVGKPRNGLMVLVNKGILPANFCKELIFGGIAQSAKTQSTNREAIFDAITSINTRAKSEYGTMVYEMLLTDIPMTVSLQGYI